MKPLNHTITSSSRIAIESVLKAAKRPLSAREVSELSGISISITRTHLGSAVQHGRAHNLNPSKRNSALYVWGQQEFISRETTPRFIPTGTYDGKDLRPFTARAGAMDAYEIGSVRGGVSVPRGSIIALV